MTNEKKWIHTKNQLPRRWKWVIIQDAYGREFIACRNLFGNWKYQSGLTDFLFCSNYWRPLEN